MAMKCFLKDGQRVDWPEALSILAETKPIEHLGDGVCLIVTMWRMDDITLAPIECSIEIEKVRGEELGEILGKPIYDRTFFHLQDYEGHPIDDIEGEDPEACLRLAIKHLDEVDTEVLLRHISEDYQVEQLVQRPQNRVDNTVYNYGIYAVVTHPDCYLDLGWKKQNDWCFEGSGQTPRAALENLCEKLMSHGDHYRRTQDAFQVYPYREHKPGDDAARCKRCGKVMDDSLLIDGDKHKWACPNEYCPHHKLPQY